MTHSHASHVLSFKCGAARSLWWSLTLFVILFVLEYPSMTCVKMVSQMFAPSLLCTLLIITTKVKITFVNSNAVVSKQRTHWLPLCIFRGMATNDFFLLYK